MRIKMYVDGNLAFDNHLPSDAGYGLHSIAISESINKGGTATLLIPRAHPRRDQFRPYSVPVEIYRDGKLRWRGRPLPLSNEDTYGRRTIICEGEMCFLQDAIHRPYSYFDEASDVFAEVLSVYNATVEPWKRFSIGAVTVTGIADITNKNPENCLEVIQKLVEKCGGYIIFDDAPDGGRQINWFKSFPYSCNQTVRYGYNLTEYSRAEGSSGFATRIVPYGKADSDGNRVTINIGGKDYVENEEAVALYGIVERSVTYNDIEDPSELRTRAERDVAVCGLVPSVITMSAVDMSRQNLTLDSFAVGQRVPAESALHNLYGEYYLTAISEDLVNPSLGGITLQRELASISSRQDKTLSAAVTISKKGVQSAVEEGVDMSIAAMTQELIFNKLTNNGEQKCIYILDGQLFINADFIKSGRIISSNEAYLPPTWKECDEAHKASNGWEIPNAEEKYDYDGDGKFDALDVLWMYRLLNGIADISEHPPNAKSTVDVVIDPANPEAAVLISGKNIWGSDIVVSLGASGSRIPLIKGDCAISGKLTAGGVVNIKNLSVDTYGVEPKALSWKDNGDGTYSLIGSDIVQQEE